MSVPRFGLQKRSSEKRAGVPLTTALNTISKYLSIQKTIETYRIEVVGFLGGFNLGKKGCAKDQSWQCEDGRFSDQYGSSNVCVVPPGLGSDVIMISWIVLTCASCGLKSDSFRYSIGEAVFAAFVPWRSSVSVPISGRLLRNGGLRDCKRFINGLIVENVPPRVHRLSDGQRPSTRIASMTSLLKPGSLTTSSSSSVRLLREPIQY